MDLVDLLIICCGSAATPTLICISNYKPQEKKKLKRVCKEYTTSPRDFARQIFEAMPELLKRPVCFSAFEEIYGGTRTTFRKRIRLSSRFMVEYFEAGYKSVLEDYSLCLTYGHEFSHYLYPQKKKLPISKRNSIIRVMREVKADIEGRLFFMIPQEEAYRIMIREGKEGGFDKEHKKIINRCTHPDWSDRCTYILEYPEYNAELEKRIKRDYCQKLKCPYSKVAGLTLLDDNIKTQEVLKELRETRQIAPKSL